MCSPSHHAIPEGISRLKPVIKPLLPRVISILLLEALCGPPFDPIESVDTAVSLGVTKSYCDWYFSTYL